MTNFQNIVRFVQSPFNIKQKAKVKSKCTECFTDRTLFDKINDEYDLEELVKKIFFTDVFYKRTWRLIAWSVEKTLKI